MARQAGYTGRRGGESAPEPTVTKRPTTPLDNVRAAVADAVADGQMDPKRAADFIRRLDEMEHQPNRGKKKGNQSVADLTNYLESLVKKGELTRDAYTRIQAAVSQL